MTKQRFLKFSGIGSLISIILVMIIGFAVGQSARDVGNILSFVVPTILVIGGVFYFFWWLVSMGLSKSKASGSAQQSVKKGYVPFADRRAALNRMPMVKNLWIVLIIYMVASSIYGIVRLALEFVQTGDLSKAQDVLKGMPLTGLAIGGTLMALVFIALQVIYIGSIYRMEKWVLWFMLAGFLGVIIPSFQVSNLYALIANTLILGVYYYIIRKVYSSSSPATAQKPS